ncbi:hypothetical protein [Ferrimonas aestuarii]|uniref:Uncharacterized protein n=1 Tax=Ferrimonas aestuarii TaxID=2569539 RepID=A0A4V5NYE4_9GAMM|nr:hypothetical protein [Ferrimonas aestuarii]TKB53276.1 hypothetical protein FCL42_14485 [Ferrimonas aestuarii]
MALFFFSLLIWEQIISYQVEVAFWGEPFPHHGDLIAALVCGGGFLYYANALGNFLLDLHLNSKVERSETQINQ